MDKCRESFESKYRELHPDDKCTMMKNGNYSGWIKQAHWWMWQSQQAEINRLQSQINEMAEVGLGQESALMEKGKRIEELESRIKNQIETLKCASKSWVYTEREQNIMLSQADDLEKALRGDHE